MGKETKKKIGEALMSSLSGLSSVAVSAALMAFDSAFPRYERPDYALKPGDYCYDRVKDRLKREEFTFPSEDNMLKGYYYPTEKPKGLILISHGFHAGADDYIPMTEFFVSHGYAVMSFDYTGTYDSEGDSLVGMCQSLVDIDSAINYINKTRPYCNMPLYLVGHSWGGYAVASVLELQPRVMGAACIAPMYNGYTIMWEKGEEYAGKAASFPKPVFNQYLKVVFGKYVNCDSVKGINSTDAPVIIAQGIDDKIITYNGSSIMAHKGEITNPNAIFIDGKGLFGDHCNIWHSLESIQYQLEVASDLKLLEMKKGVELSYEEKASYYETVNHTLYSAPNEKLLGFILETFDKTR